jgi:DNA-binding MarR family transcriptional regulator
MKTLVLESFLPYRLNRLSALISRDFAEVYGPEYGLTIPEWRVLATLGEFEKMTAKDIGAHSSMHKTKVSRAVRTLEDRRWIWRQANQQDRREAFLGLTSHGRKTYVKIIPRAIAFEKMLLNAFGPTASDFLAALSHIEMSRFGTVSRGRTV